MASDLQVTSRRSTTTASMPARESGEDRLFAEPRPFAKDFAFDDRTAAVFDDMVGRSVPFYAEIQRMAAEMAADFAVPGTNLYDLGCSTGTTFEALDPVVDRGVRFIGIDNSDAMLAKAAEKAARFGADRSVEFINGDLNKPLAIENASVVTLILTLQFVRPLYREQILRNIFAGMNANGCLILVEKLTIRHSLLNRLFIRYYYAQKRRAGYSETEITQKREALENVMIPYRLEENVEMLERVGFQYVETFFRWYNFCGIIAVK